MKNGKRGNQSADPQALAALRRAAREALDHARQTNTPCYVQQDGKIVDIAASKMRKRRSRATRSKE